VRKVAAEINDPEKVVVVIEDGPMDNRILECVLASGAEIIVTGDKKQLLPLGSFPGASIVGMRDFLALFSAD
jgi:uncharacterized protein